MELELKHLAPYLNHDLQFQGGHWMIGLSNLKRDNYNIHDQRMILCSDKKQGVQTWECFPEMVKPLLRPLSDLTKEIENNGEKFVPMNAIDQIHSIDFNCVTGLFSDSNSSNYEIDWLPYAVIKKLHECHFDVFGLIEAGLAIDLNTINK